jgi:uncharacterized small protein (DUF1192 family)
MYWSGVAARSISDWAGFPCFTAEIAIMNGRKDVAPTPERIARANRQRLASEEGARAMAEVEQRAAAVRKNMERLRALRQAKDAQEPSAPAVVPKKAVRKSSKSRAG